MNNHKETILNLQLLAEDGEGAAAAVGAAEQAVGGEAQQAAQKMTGMRRSDAALRSHFDSLQKQARAMQGRYAEFDLQRELADPVFFKLTGPDVGLGVEDAYMAVHHREMTRAVTEGVKRELSNAIRAGAARPEEHGLGGRAAAVAQFDYRNADRTQRRAFKQQIYAAAARGEKIYPVNRERFC